MKKIALLCFLASVLFSTAQEKASITEIIDDLTVKWDERAITLRTYQDIHNFCGAEALRANTVYLLDQIHHWDTTLYFIVRNKYADKKDKEAEATLRDIETLETDYTTESFKHFIQDECATLKVIEDHFDEETVRAYEKEIIKFEKELVKYVVSITSRIDIVDEHIHHLKLD
ncbi:MAG: hypothetical protein ABJG78_12615 [Cyclobacteriaceae bacterium]